MSIIYYMKTFIIDIELHDIFSSARFIFCMIFIRVAKLYIERFYQIYIFLNILTSYKLN